MNFLEDLKRLLQNQVDSIREEIIRIAEYIYNNPELGYAEFKARKLLTSVLVESGFEEIRGLPGLLTAFKTVMKGKKDAPVVGILAEYDVLPELEHACGHNLNAATAIGAGIVLSKLMPKCPRFRGSGTGNPCLT
jgi:metal-dependent amidase/aminoacylase/carboxypeptidase family protein